MITKENIQSLAEFARIEVKDEEIESIRQKMEGVLDYVSEVQNLSKENASLDTLETGDNHNVFRQDENPHPERKYTDSLIKNAPEKEGDYIKVRKIL